MSHFFVITRISPKFFRGEKVSGYVGKMYMNDIQEISNLYGGGVYDIRAFELKDGSIKLLKSRRVDIAGDPITSPILPHKKNDMQKIKETLQFSQHRSIEK